MAAIGDVYQIIDTQEMAGQKVLNVYFYKVTLSVLGADASDVTAAFIDQMLPDIVAVQATDVVHTSVKATNLFHDTDVNEALISEPGILGDASLGTFEAYPFRLAGDNGSVRGGAKRIAGVTEDGISDGVVTDAGLLTTLTNLGIQLSAAMLWGTLDGGTLAPVIVKRILDAGNYRLPATSGEAVLSNIIDAIFSPLVTSQTSRKVGRGM